MRPSSDRIKKTTQETGQQTEQRQQLQNVKDTERTSSRKDRKIKVVKSRRPLQHFHFYLDIVDQPLAKRVEDKIKALGGQLEFILSEKVTHFVTDKTVLPPILLTSAKSDITTDQTQPATPTKQADTPRESARLTTPISDEQQQQQQQPIGGGAIRKSYQSRNDTLLQSAKCLNSTVFKSSLPDLSTENLKTPASFSSSPYTIWQANSALNFLAKVERDLKAYLATGKHIQVIHLKDDFIKIEDFEGNFRPAFYSFPEPYIWPKIDSSSKEGAFCYSKNQSQKGREKLRRTAENNKGKLERTVMTRYTRSKSSQRSVRLNAGTIATTPAAVKEETSNKKEPTKESSTKQFGVCEICKIEYDVLRLHLKSKTHELFAKNPKNFIELDKLIEATADIKFITEENEKLPKLESGLNVRTNYSPSSKKKQTPTRTNPALPMREKSKRSTKGKHSSEKFQQKSPLKRTFQSLSEIPSKANDVANVQKNYVPLPKEAESTTSARRAILPKSAMYKVVELSAATDATPRTRRSCARFHEAISEPTLTSKSKLVIKVQKVRSSELDRLRDDTESLMFPKPRLSSELLTDTDRQSTSEFFNVTRSSLTSNGSSEADVLTLPLVGGRRTNNSIAAAVTASNTDTLKSFSPTKVRSCSQKGTFDGVENVNESREQETGCESPADISIIELSGGRRTNNSAAAAISASVNCTDISPIKTRNRQRFQTAPIQPQVQLKQEFIEEEEVLSIPKLTSIKLPEATRKSTRTATAIVSAATTSSRLLRAAVEAEKIKIRSNGEKYSAELASAKRLTRSISTAPAVVHPDDGMGENHIVKANSKSTAKRKPIRRTSDEAEEPSVKKYAIASPGKGESRLLKGISKLNAELEKLEGIIHERASKPVIITRNGRVVVSTIVHNLNATHTADEDDFIDDQTETDDLCDEDYVQRTPKQSVRTSKSTLKLTTRLNSEERSLNRAPGRTPRFASKNSTQKDKTPQKRQVKSEVALAPPKFNVETSEYFKDITYSFERKPRTEYWFSDQYTANKINYPLPNVYPKLPYELGPIPLVMTKECNYCKFKRERALPSKADPRDEVVTKHEECNTDKGHESQEYQQHESKTDDEIIAIKQEATSHLENARCVAASVSNASTINFELNNTSQSTTETITAKKPTDDMGTMIKEQQTDGLNTLARVCASYKRASSTYSNASSSCTSSSASVNKKLMYRNKYLDRLTEPARKSPREHASTLALVSRIHRQRLDSLSKTNSDCEDVQSDLQRIRKPSQIISEYKIDRSNTLHEPVINERNEEGPQISSESLNSESNSKGLAAVNDFATEIAEHVKCMRRGRNKCEEIRSLLSKEKEIEQNVEAPAKKTIADSVPDVAIIHKRRRGRPPKRFLMKRAASSSATSSTASSLLRRKGADFKASLLLGKRRYIRKQLSVRTNRFPATNGGIRKLASKKGIPEYEFTAEALLSLERTLEYKNPMKELRAIEQFLETSNRDVIDHDVSEVDESFVTASQLACEIDSADQDADLYDLIEQDAHLMSENLFTSKSFGYNKLSYKRKIMKTNRTGWPKATRRRSGLRTATFYKGSSGENFAGIITAPAAATAATAAVDVFASNDEHSLSDVISAEQSKDCTDNDEVISAPHSVSNPALDDYTIMDSIDNTTSDSMYSVAEHIENAAAEMEDENENDVFEDALEDVGKNNNDDVEVKSLSIEEEDILSEGTSSISTPIPPQRQANDSQSVGIKEKCNDIGITYSYLAEPGASNKKDIQARQHTPIMNGSLPSVGSCNSPLEKIAGNSDIFTVSSDGLETDIDASNQLRVDDRDQQQRQHDSQLERNSRHHISNRKYGIIGSAASCAAEAATAVTKSLAISRFLKKEVRVNCRRVRAPYHRRHN